MAGTSNFLSMREEEIDSAISGFDKCATGMGTTGAGINGKFKGATDVGLMNGTVSAVSREVNLISSAIGNVKNMMRKHTNEMFDYDRTMAKMANDIEIPQDFLANNAMEVNQYNKILVGKIDGRSVNDGEEAQKISDIDESEINAEGLTDIRGAAAKEEIYDDSSVIGKSTLGSIVGNVTEKQEYDDTVNVNKSALQNINGNQTQQQEYDGESVIQGQSTLGTINKNVASQQQDYDASLSIAAAQSLGNINNNNTSNVQNLDQTTMAAAFDNFAANEFEEAEKKKKKAEEELEHVDYEEFEKTDNV